MFKDILKTGLGVAGCSPVLAPVVQRVLSERVNIVYYHFATNKPAPHYVDSFTDCTLARLARDLATLSAHFQFVPLERILQFNQDSADSKGPPLMAITFDDGLDLIGSGVADVLETHKVSATTFVVTSCIDNRNLTWPHKLSAIRALAGDEVITKRFNELAVKTGLFGTIRSAKDLFRETFLMWPMARKEEFADELWSACAMLPVSEYLAEHAPYFTWDGLGHWVQRGHSVGLHSHTHPVCARLPSSLVETEICGPAELLKKKLQLKSVSLAYPFGSRLPEDVEERLYCDKVIDCALGIRGFSKRRTPPFRLERARVEEEFRYNVFGKPLVASLLGRW